MEQLLGTRKKELAATPFLVLQTKTRVALLTNEKGLFVPACSCAKSPRYSRNLMFMERAEA